MLLQGADGTHTVPPCRQLALTAMQVYHLRVVVNAGEYLVQKGQHRRASARRRGCPALEEVPSLGLCSD
jgi:hypothetical protein